MVPAGTTAPALGTCRCTRTPGSRCDTRLPRRAPTSACRHGSCCARSRARGRRAPARAPATRRSSSWRPSRPPRRLRRPSAPCGAAAFACSELEASGAGRGLPPSVASTATDDDGGHGDARTREREREAGEPPPAPHRRRAAELALETTFEARQHVGGQRLASQLVQGVAAPLDLVGVGSVLGSRVISSSLGRSLPGPGSRGSLMVASRGRGTPVRRERARQLGAGTEEPRLRGSLGDLDDLGRLGGRQAEDVAEHRDRAELR